MVWQTPRTGGKEVERGMERVVRPMERTGLVMGRLGVEDDVAGWIEIRSNAVTAGERQALAASVEPDKCAGEREKTSVRCWVTVVERAMR